MQTPSLAVRATPWLFVLIWSTGFVVAKLAAPHADPLTFLLLRYLGVIVLMGALAWLARASWPKTRREVLHLAVAGIGIQAGYLGGVWAAVANGMPAGITALVVNLQPVLTAVAAPLIGERLTRGQAVGLVLGFLGVTLVVWGGLTTSGITWATLGLTTLALLSITIGTMYQKRFLPDFDLRTGQVVQFGAAIAVTLPFALAFESLRFEVNASSIGALLWSVLVLTGGGVSLLYLMIRRGAATQVTSYFYLVPAVTALLAWAVFGETLSAVAVAGMLITITGVALATRSRTPAPTRG